MKTSYILIGIVIAVVVIGGVFVLRSNSNTQTPTLKEEETVTPPMMEEGSQSSLMVSYTDGGYSPKELTIKKGEVVTFKNESSQPMWTASAVHPNHTAYPGTDIKNCGSTTMVDKMFDSCAGVSSLQVWKFQFNETGSWKYHNHLTPTRTGTITVE